MVAPAILAIPPIVEGIVWLGAALGITHMVAPGKEEREQSIRDLGNAIAGNNSSAMSNAQDDAKANADGRTDATTCTGDCPPPPNTPCGALYAQIETATAELAARRAAMLADRAISAGGLGMYELFLRDSSARVPDPRGIRPHLGNWIGHRDQILQKQSYLKGLLDQYKAAGCSPLPLGAETQANLPPPIKPFGY